MTDEEIILSSFIRYPKRTRLENLECCLLSDDFMPGMLREAFDFVLKRISMNKSVDPADIYLQNQEAFKSFDCAVSGLALFCSWALNREADGKFKESAKRIKHFSKVRKNKGKLSAIITTK